MFNAASQYEGLGRSEQIRVVGRYDNARKNTLRRGISGGIVGRGNDPPEK